MAEVKVEEKIQKVIEQLNSGANFSPEFVREFFISNILSRAFAYLFGWDYLSGEPVKLQATPDGILRVSTFPSYYTINETFSGNAPDTYGTPIAFGDDVQHVDIWIEDNAAIFQRSLNGTLWYSEIKLFANSYYCFDATTRYIRIKNAVSGAVAKYQIVGWR